MKYEKVLKQIEDGELTSQEALNILYPEPKTPKPGKRAHFIKMSVHIPEEGKGLNTFLKILFAIPIPMIFARIGLRFGQRFVKDEDIDFEAIREMLKYSRNTKVQVDTDDAQVNIRIM
jgi:hypothetical protein